jgi:hypothetical protein
VDLRSQYIRDLFMINAVYAHLAEILLNGVRVFNLNHIVFESCSSDICMSAYTYWKIRLCNDGMTAEKSPRIGKIHSIL